MVDKPSIELLQECEVIANEYLANKGETQKCSFVRGVDYAYLHFYFGEQEWRAKVFGKTRTEIAESLILYTTKKLKVNTHVKKEILQMQSPNCSMGFSVEEVYRPSVAFAAKIFGMGVALGLTGNQSFEAGWDFSFRDGEDDEVEIRFPLPYRLKWSLRVKDKSDSTKFLFNMARVCGQDEKNGRILRELIEQNENSDSLPNIMVARWFARAYLGAMIYAVMTAWK